MDDRAQLSADAKRAALAALLQQRAAKPRSFPLSFAQQRVWYAQQLDADTPFFNPALAVALAGRLRPAVLARCLAEIVRRHEALRTVFAADGGRQVQTIAPPQAPPLPVVDLAALPAARRAGAGRALALAAARRPIGLADGLLLRAALLRAGEREHTLLLNLHHIAADGWSLGVIAGELAQLYAAFAAGSPSPLPALPLQYKDFAVWERQQAPAAAGELLAYWRGRLAGLPQLELPVDRPRPLPRTWNGASVPLVVPAAVTEGVRALCREAGATLSMAALALFQALLCRHSGQEDLAVGVSVANRERAEVAPLIGHFSNILVMRGDLGGNPTFAALLARVRGTALDDYAHQELSFDRLAEELRPPRDPSRHPLVQVMFGLRNAPAPRHQLPDLTLSLLDLDSGLARFDLELILWEEGRELCGALLYNTDLFFAATALRLQAELLRLFAAAVAAPDRPLLELPLLCPAECHQLTCEWNDTATPAADAGRPILAWIEAATARDPAAVALSSGDEELSWGELRRRSVALARHLGERGAVAGSRVGLLLDRSLLWPVALLACLRAGAAFVPLDPRSPRERLAAIAADAALGFVLTASGRGLPEPPAIGVVIDLHSLPLLSAAPAAQAAGAPGGESWPRPAAAGGEVAGGQAAGGEVAGGEAAGEEAPAYLVYTSGSTGVPKGVAVARRNLGGYATLAGHLGIGPGDVYLHSAALGFAAAVRQLLAPLSRGAAVVMAGAAELADPLALCRLVRRRRVTVLDLVPSYWQSLGTVLAGLAPAVRHELLDNDLRLLTAASEPLPTAVARRWVEEWRPSARFVHFLGHSETSGIDALYPLPRVAAAPAPPLVPLGRPAPDRRIHLLDPRLRAVPLGAVGEIAIGGAAAAAGYWRRPELTAATFLPDPFGGEPGARLYRSGDLGRFLADGTLVFVGRKDRQVKVRGHRIEAGEIEAVLAAVPGVGRAVVEARPVAAAASGAEAGGAPQLELVAYLAPAAGEGGGVAAIPAPAELRRRVAARLPPPMVPAAFVVLDELPLTTTGKLDRGALPAPAAAGARDHVAPRTAVEARLAAVWSEVLGVPRVGALDDFFDLRGHSLLAVVLAARIREAFGVELGLQAVLTWPTVAGHAAAVEERLIEAAGGDELAELVAEVAALSPAEVQGELGRFAAL